MITKEQAIRLGEIGGEIHYTGQHDCNRHVGQRGAVKINVMKVRPNGMCQVWATRLDEFRLPCKYGLKTYLQITQSNAHLFHVEADCPLNMEAVKE